MRSLTMVLGSFVLGMVCMFFIDHHGATPSVLAQRSGETLNAFVPVVPRPPRSINDGGIFENGTTVDIDGANITNAVFRNGVVFRYGGGYFNLVNSRIDSSTKVELVGAAANTVAFLQLLRANVPAKPEPIAPKTPITRTIERMTIQNTLQSPY
jgi:hypothetical protein